MAGYTREFLSIEQALKEIIRKLESEEIKSATGKSESALRKCSDENDLEHHLHLKDAIELDVACMRRGLGHPLLSAHEILVEKSLKNKNDMENITTSLINIGGRIGHLMEVTQKAIDPNSEGGTAVSKQEKEDIYKAINELEEKIANLKLSIGIKS